MNTLPPEQKLHSCLTIDVEEYFHIEAAHGHVSKSQWDTMPSRVANSVHKLLELMDQHNCRATFFILGDVARRCPQIAKTIANAGHEIASHGTNHDRLHRLNSITFAQDLTISKKILEDQTGQAVRGYRAPTFSVVPDTAWAIDVLLNAGFDYVASIFPVMHPAYGVPDAPVTPFYVTGPSGRKLLEVPPLVWEVGKKHVAVAGGGYFRLLPLWFMKRGLKQSLSQNRPAVLYFHPWEFDPDIPRLPLPLTGRLRTYLGLKSALRKLDHILSLPGREWTTMSSNLDHFHAMASNGKPYALAA